MTTVEIASAIGVVGAVLAIVGVVGEIAHNRRSYTGHHRPGGTRPGGHRVVVVSGTDAQRAHYGQPTEEWASLATARSGDVDH